MTNKYFGYDIASVVSEVGGVLVGNNDWCCVLKNGIGDGITQCYIFDDKEVFAGSQLNSADFMTMIAGKFNIFACDYCEDDVLAGKDVEIKYTLEGKYYVYRSRQEETIQMIFVKQ